MSLSGVEPPYFMSSRAQPSPLLHVILGGAQRSRMDLFDSAPLRMTGYSQKLHP
jgi:hypothetical protein